MSYAWSMETARPQTSAATPGDEIAIGRTSARASTRGVLRPRLTEPEVVPMTPQQHDQAVDALATMICDWLRAQRPATAAEKPEDPGPQPTDREK
jgi:hypothetical protein